MIDSAIWSDEWFGALPAFEKLVWIGLFGTCADDQGRLLDNTALIRAALFPYEDQSLDAIEQALTHFAEAQKIIRYEADRKRLVQVARWWEHQRPQWAQASKWTPPVGWLDRIRTRQNGQYVEINWKPEARMARAIQQPTAQDVQVKHSPEPFTRSARAGRQNPNPNPNPITTTTTTARASAPQADLAVKELFGLLSDAGVRIKGDMMRDDYLDLLEITSDSTLLFDAIRDVVENLGDPSPKLLRSIVETCVREHRRPGQRAEPRSSPDPPPKPRAQGPIRILNPNTHEIEVIGGNGNAAGCEITPPG